MQDFNKLFQHRDDLDFLNQNSSLKEKLNATQQQIQQQIEAVAHIALALYDADTRLLKTYLHSGSDNTLEHYQALLDQAPMLLEILRQGHPRVINNTAILSSSTHEHSQRILKQGYAASYTMPMYNNSKFIGFLFFNSCETDVFDEKTLGQLDLYGHLIALLVVNELNAVQTLTAAVKSTSRMANMRDPETGSHLDRMSRYSRLIARALATQYELDDDYIEHVFMFAPLHDIGKIAIPDHILLKPGKLTSAEMQVMQTHTQRGREIIDDVLENFGLAGVGHMHILRNIALFHHESVNGSGYPEGKRGADIPLEARIVAVADVFDALTSKRPYKKAWSNDEAFAYLQQLVGEKLDRDCVAALLSQRKEIEAIQQCFEENIYY